MRRGGPSFDLFGSTKMNVNTSSTETLRSTSTGSSGHNFSTPRPVSLCP